MMRLRVALLFAVALYALGQSCVPDENTGCLNGVAFDYKEQFVCRDDIYDFAKNGCCAQGLVFDTRESYCCFDGIHDFTDSRCVEWNPKGGNDEEDHGAAEVSFEWESYRLQRASLSGGNAEIQTIDACLNDAPPQGCEHGTEQFGCFNGWRYKWRLEYVCGCHIVPFATTGCCNRQLYSLANESCCYDESVKSQYGPYVVVGHGHACEAKGY